MERAELGEINGLSDICEIWKTYEYLWCKEMFEYMYVRYTYETYD